MDQPASRTIELHRAASGKDLMEAMYFAEMDEVQMRGLTRLVEANYANGYVIRVLFSSEALGVSLTYSWFKQGFPLPRHSHSADCLYYIVSGEIHYGSEVLMAGDCMSVPAGALYTFETGPDGVEFLEFRKAARYDISYQTTEKVWDRQVEQTKANAEAWKSAQAPLAAQRMTAGTHS
jgi:mannose-6-phosphate isomerase-like protein (cupin superfamily)